jgi:hypothetical protein
MQFDANNVPSEIGYYLTGFADGEGSFNFSFRRRSDYKSGWKISACFNVSNKDLVILQLFKKHLTCGTLRSRPDDVWYYEVNTIKHLVSNVIPFFKRFPFLSDKKRNDFSKFCEILDIILSKKTFSSEVIRIILDLRNQMNNGGKRKFSDKEILATFNSSN